MSAQTYEMTTVIHAIAIGFSGIGIFVISCSAAAMKRENKYAKLSIALSLLPIFGTWMFDYWRRAEFILDIQIIALVGVLLGSIGSIRILRNIIVGHSKAGARKDLTSLCE